MKGNSSECTADWVNSIFFFIIVLFYVFSFINSSTNLNYVDKNTKNHSIPTSPFLSI